MPELHLLASAGAPLAQSGSDDRSRGPLASVCQAGAAKNIDWSYLTAVPPVNSGRLLELANDARFFAAVALGLRGRRRHDAGPLVVGLDQPFGLGQPLPRVTAQKTGVGCPCRTWTSFQPRLKVSCMETFMPCPAFGNVCDRHRPP